MKMRNSRTFSGSVLLCFLLIAASLFLYCGCDGLDLMPAAQALPVTTTFAVTKRPDVVTKTRVSSVQEITYDNGEKYAGFIKDGLPHGYGIKSYPDGSRYEGYWLNGYENGMGTYYFSNGDWLEGEWKNGMANGPGTYFRANGESITGFWKNNEPQSTSIR